MTTLIAKHLEKSYKNRRVVKDVSITVSSGEIVGLLGPNGAGKTTSFYMIVGLVSPNKGEILLDDLPITHYPMHKRARLGIGYLPQEKSIFRKLTVCDNIMAILQLRKDLSKKEKENALNLLLDEFHIAHLKNVSAMSLSGGETRRVEIARALATNPKFILLDEPFAGVDPISVNDIKMVIRQLHDKGIGVLITDHNVRETLDICERAYIVSDGNIICDGEPQEILKNKKVQEVYLGSDFNL